MHCHYIDMWCPFTISYPCLRSQNDQTRTQLTTNLYQLDNVSTSSDEDNFIMKAFEWSEATYLLQCVKLKAHSKVKDGSRIYRNFLQ